MKYYFVKFMFKGIGRDFEHSQVFGVDKSLNHIEAFIEIQDRIKKASVLDLNHITYLKELS